MNTRHNINEVVYNKQTQYVRSNVTQIDEYTVEDAYEVFDKTEEMMLLEEMLESIGYMGGSTVQIIGMEEF